MLNYLEEEEEKNWSLILDYQQSTTVNPVYTIPSRLK
jgi:hypothetical protein